MKNIVIIILVLALCLSLLNGRCGLGFGRGSKGDSPFPSSGESASSETSQSVTKQSQAEPTPETEIAPTDDGRLEIVVREDQILYESEAVDLAALEEALLRDYAVGVTVTLTDDHAIMATYDEVAALLASLNIPTE